MRLHLLATTLALVSGIALAQETNFPTGPQYLMNYGSPFLFHSIATPSLDLNAPPASITAEGSSESQVVPAPANPQSPANLTRIYWGERATGEAAGESSEIEATSPATSPALPHSFLDVGVAEITDAQSLAARGYGMTLAEASALAKAHRKLGSHVYTNEDLARLHGG